MYFLMFAPARGFFGAKTVASPCYSSKPLDIPALIMYYVPNGKKRLKSQTLLTERTKGGTDAAYSLLQRVRRAALPPIAEFLDICRRRREKSNWNERQVLRNPNRSDDGNNGGATRHTNPRVPQPRAADRKNRRRSFQTLSSAASGEYSVMGYVLKRDKRPRQRVRSTACPRFSTGSQACPRRFRRSRRSSPCRFRFCRSKSRTQPRSPSARPEERGYIYSNLKTLNLKGDLGFLILKRRRKCKSVRSKRQSFLTDALSP